jgi:hypothetical protein
MHDTTVRVGLPTIDVVLGKRSVDVDEAPMINKLGLENAAFR